MSSPEATPSVAPIEGAELKLGEPLSSPALRPGLRTSEFALSLAAIVLSACFAVDLIPTSGIYAKVAAIAAIVLTSLGYTVSRTRVKTSATLLVLILAIGVVPPSMGCTSAARGKALSATLASADALSAAFVAFDAARQDDIIEKATSIEAGQAELAAWRATQSRVRALLANVYRAVAIAKMADDDASVATALAAVSLLKQTLSTIGVQL